MHMIVPVGCLIAGAYWVIKGFDYGFWVRKGPGPGFLPVLAGAIVVVFCIVVIISNSKDKDPARVSRKVFIPIVALLGLGPGCYVVGMIISLALFLFCWLRFAEKRNTFESLVISAATTVILYSIFVLWLVVPMPKGVLGLF